MAMTSPAPPSALSISATFFGSARDAHAAFLAPLPHVIALDMGIPGATQAYAFLFPPSAAPSRPGRRDRDPCSNYSRFGLPTIFRTR